LTADLHDPLYERLVKILGALRVIESRRDTVEAEAEFLCRTFRSLPDGLSLKEVERELRSWVGLPPAPPAKRIERELQEFVREASKLRDRVSRMSKGAFDVMKVDRASIDLDGLIALEDAARWALSLRKQWEVGPRAKPRKLRAERVADAAASAFERLTGKPWTVPFNPETHKSYGPCLKFLEAVFTACGIDASAET
jgi:hypothetical protein